ITFLRFYGDLTSWVLYRYNDIDSSRRQRRETTNLRISVKPPSLLIRREHSSQLAAVN
ncbi:hypothetical protein L9F63_023280, partial [Diploptera punctata]